MFRVSLHMNKEDVLSGIVMYVILYIFPIILVMGKWGVSYPHILGAVLVTNILLFLFTIIEYRSIRVSIYFILTVFLTPILFLLGVVGRIIPYKKVGYEEHIKLKGKLKVINIFKGSHNSAINTHPKTVTDIEINNLVRKINKDYLNIEDIPERTEGKYNQLESINNVFKSIKDNLNREVKLENGYVTRLYNVLKNQGDKVVLSSKVEYIKDDNEKVLAVDTIYLEDEDLINLTKMLYTTYKSEEEYIGYTDNIGDIWKSEKDRLEKLEYYRENMESQNKLKEEVNDKLIK